MYKTSRLIVILLSVVTLTPLRAQGPAGPPRGGPLGGGGGGGPFGNAAVFLLAQKGELKLSDAQVVRLAAIARRADERRRALGAQLDSVRPARPTTDRRRQAACRSSSDKSLAGCDGKSAPHIVGRICCSARALCSPLPFLGSVSWRDEGRELEVEDAAVVTRATTRIGR